MLDEYNNTKLVVCLITHKALQDRAAADDNQQDWQRAWREHRSHIENLASVNCDDGRIEKDGRVIVQTRDLTPVGGSFQTRWPVAPGEAI